MGPWTSYLNKRDNYHLLSACLWQTLGIAHGFYLLPHLRSEGAGPDHTQAWIIKRGRAETPPLPGLGDEGHSKGTQDKSSCTDGLRHRALQVIPRKPQGPSGLLRDSWNTVQRHGTWWRVLTRDLLLLIM